MSLIVKKLNSLFTEVVKSANEIEEKDLMSHKDKVTCVIGVLRPEQTKDDFIHHCKFKIILERELRKVPDCRCFLYIFLLDSLNIVYIRELFPYSGVKILTCSDRDSDMKCWALKLSINFIDKYSKRKSHSIVNDYVDSIKEKEVNDELTIISGLLRIHYT